MINYTTVELISKIDPKNIEAAKAENDKMIISNDAYSLIDAITKLTNSIDLQRMAK